MAYEILTYGTKRSFWPTRYYNDPGGLNVILQDPDRIENDKTSIIRNNLKDSRPFPTDKIASQTGQPPQYRDRYRTALMLGPLHPFYSLYRRYQATQTPGNQTTTGFVFPELDWQTEMRLQIKEVSVNLGVSLAEYRQTARMFSQFATGVSKGWRSWKGRYHRRHKLSVCDVAAAELITSYGIMPLASDLFESWQQLDVRLRSKIIRRFSTFAKDNGSDTYTSGHQYDIKYKVSERATAYVELEPDWKPFTLGNPLELGWELIPFSFVVDWAIPVGDALRALDALKDVKTVSGTVVHKERYEHYIIPQNVLSNGWILLDEGYYRSNRHRRDVISEIPLPRVPTWDPSSSWRAVVHGLSLLTTLRKTCQK